MSVDLELWGSSMIGESALMSSLILAPLVALSVTCGREKAYTQASTTTIDFELKLKYHKYLMSTKQNIKTQS